MTALDAVAGAIEARLGATPLVVGLCGAQGSGKSTLAGALADRLNAKGRVAAILSLDDLYKTKAEREALARDVHPLLRTRGVPGTHDIALGLAVIDAFRHERAAPLPRFDKARDDRAGDWGEAPAATDVLILEGWCAGARPQPAEQLAHPINSLEQNEDPDGRWRAYVNDALGGDYQRLFAELDLLVLLAAPGFEVVRAWRLQQEHDLRARTGGGMSDDEVSRFILHYERLTRHILEEMPARADLVLDLGPDRSVRRAGCV
jgi:D-glycerate 3-kinase